MITNRRFTSALQDLTEIESEVSRSGARARAAPTLIEVFARLGPMPAGALFLGIASDGLPILLNLHDPHPGPMLVAGDAGSGKTIFLQTIAQSVARTHDANAVQFGVITNYPDEWQAVESTAHHGGVFPVGHSSTQEFLRALAAWTHSNRNLDQCRLLLVDDLESVASLDLESVQDLRWLLLRGPARRVWPIVTLNAPRYGQVLAWLQNFRTRVFGRVANLRVAEALGGDGSSGFEQLEPQTQFSLREKERWLRFWLPRC
jgi:hypothetical protein